MNGKRYSLDTFYESKEWRKLLEVLKLERLTEDGNIICEHCHEPIVKAYDIIGHHKIYLDEINVQDSNISLNPDNIQLVHHKCHNRIHDKLSYREDLRKIYIVFGAPSSGKTTWVNEARSDGDIIVDMDNIWQCISGLDRYVKPYQLKQCVFQIRDKLIEMIRYRVGRWRNAYIIGGYPLSSDRERLCRTLGASEVFIECPKEECIDRLIQSNDRNIEEWTKYIDDWFDRYTPRVIDE